ncbi:tripartite motif-containing protein 16-like protein isoform X2 [Toxotes jaculatrix]|uniref:tripartite motif-containing protein 16-like protein isoform X2 n=1 Tax=Toxotes jaculatrix TaxID=941984 RepID=UPI001B3AFB2C|nr:tripartite motif-containing protein 16-like protein isoform X2 [Toxotes jaculatrix]
MAEPRIPVSINHHCCRICSEVLRNPVTVPCGHNFCMQCIQKCWDKDKKNNCSCRCPECGHIFQSTPHLIKNTTLAEMVRDTENPGSEKRTKEHSGESLNVSRRPRHCTETGMSGSHLCWKHSSPLDVYCCTDDQIICAVCASAEHSGHRIGCVGEERRRKQLRNIQTKSKQILQKQRKKSKNLKKILTQIQEEARQTEDYCESVVVSVISSLQEHYLSVRALIGAQEEEATAWVQVSIKTLEAKMQEMKKRVSELDHLAEVDSNVHFLKEWPSLQRLCEEDHLNPFDEVSEDPLLPFEFTKRTVEQVGKRLEEFCDKEFASISETADRGEESPGQMEEDDMQEEREASVSQSCVFSAADRTLTQPSVEPTTRAEFLQYACELTLDPATAHVDLVVSNGDKEVMLIKAQEKIRNSPIRYPERFVHRRQVLCREGLQGERCYYEIEVVGDKAEIALTYNGIDRKSRSRLSAFGGNANSWSLDRYKNYSVSHKSGSIQLTASPTHHRIGVYLKFREGTLSFYEVSDSMNFLYKVEATFKEPLYPGFWLGEKCCIRICDLRQS